MIASKNNEDVILTDLPGNKSFTLDLEFFSDNSFVSPLVDLDRVQNILTSNRVNSPVSDFSQDRRVTVTGEDPNSAIYITKKVDLANPANSIKVLLDAYRDQTADQSSVQDLYR